MKVTFALPGIDGMSGGLRVVAQYSRHLLDQGHEVTLAIHRPSQEPGRKQKLLNMLGLRKPTLVLPADRGHFTGLDLPVIHLDEAKPVHPGDLPDADLIISTWWSTAEWADRLPRAKGRHVHFIQDFEDFEPLYTSRVHRVYRQDNAKIVVAPWLQKKLLSDFGKNSVLVVNGVDVVHFSAPERFRNARPRVGFVYANHPRKNVLLAVEAMERLGKMSAVDVMMFGTNSKPANLPGDIVYYQKPAQQEIPKLYASCDLWLFTSTSEGFGLPILEAMASRTPVIATPGGAAPDLVDGRNGRIAPFDREGFTRAILDFLDQDDAAWKVSSDAAWRTAQSYDVKLAAQAFEDALIGILSRKR